MAQRTLPGTGPATVAEAAYEDLFHPSTGDGFIGHPGDTSVFFADSTGMHIKVRTGKKALLRGSRWDADTVDVNLAVAANASGQTRIDRAVIRFDRSHVTDPWDAYPFLITGTPGAGAPALTTSEGPTGTWDLHGALVTVINGTATINPGDVARGEWYIGPGLIVCKSTSRPPHADGQLIQETDQGGRILQSSSGSWVTVFDPANPVTWSSLPGKPSTFPPSAHTHGAADISSGTVGIARLPVGTGSSQVAAGNHSHSSPAAVANQQDPVLTTTSVAFTESDIAGGALAGVVFVAPSSGRVMVHNSARMANNGDDQAILLGFRLRNGGTLGSGSTVLDAEDPRAAENTGPRGIHVGLGVLVTGLTPGGTYNVRQAVRVTGSVGSFLYRHIAVVPAP